MSNEERLEQLINELQLIMKDLGVATAYGYAVEKGYTGTEEEFAELMASYATVAQDAAHSAEQAAESATNAHNSEINAGTSEGHAERSKLDAQAAKNAAETAQGKAEEAQGKAETAETNADSHSEDAEAWAVGTRDGSPVGQTDPTYHNNAKYYAELADTKADQAADSASDASDAKDTAVSAKNAAVDAKDIAVSAKNDAVDAKDAAVSAKNDAELAETGAVNAKNDAIDAKDDAVTAKTDAQTAKDQAVTAKNDAVTAKTDAQTAKDQAVTAKNDAQTAKDQAVSAKNDAVTAKNGAVDAKDAAQAAQAAAEEAATHVADMALMQAIAPKYNSATAYKVGNLLTYLGKQYYCIADAPAGTLPTDTTYFEEKSVADIIAMIKAGEITVGKANLANNFDSKMVLTDNSGYLFRTAGGSLEIGEQNRVKKIIGASVPIIQLVKNPNFDNSQNWATVNSTMSVSNHIATFTVSVSKGGIDSATFDFVSGHKYFACFTVKSTTPATVQLYGRTSDGDIVTDYLTVSATTTRTTFSKILTASASVTGGNIRIRDYRSSDFDAIEVSKVVLVDLTATFGTTVANRLATLESSSTGTGIAKAKEILVKDYYPYNVTDFTHTKTSGKVNNGFNQFDISKVYVSGSYRFYDIPLGDTQKVYLCLKDKDTSVNVTGCDIGFFNRKGSPSNYVWVLENGVYKSKSYRYNYKDGEYLPYLAVYPNDATTLEKLTKRFDICINFSWDGERDGEYEPYQEWNYPVQDIELKGILSLDAQDNWIADGDEYLPSGVVNEKITTVVADGTNLVWNVYEGAFFATLSTTFSKIINKAICNKAIYAGFNTGISNLISSGRGKFALRSDENVLQYYPADSSITTVGALNTWLRSNPLTFQLFLATPTQSSADPYTELQNDSNWGTEKWIDTRDVPLPVFSTCEYIPDLKAKLETAPESPDEDGDYIMRRENGLNSYSSLSTAISALGITPATQTEVDSAVSTLIDF